MEVDSFESGWLSTTLMSKKKGAWRPERTPILQID
jgi:hypothetical protein